MKCSICGKEFEKQMFSGRDVCSPECFEKDYWKRALSEDNFIVINGVYYSDAGFVENPKNTSFLGCSGRLFKIRMNDGREFVTNNLWVAGPIPKEYNVPDNATFL